MYTGSLGSASNKEDWVMPFSLVDATDVPLSLSTAVFSLYITDPDNPSCALVTGLTSDGSTFAVSVDGFTVTWTIPKAKMSALCAGNYSVFMRMLLNGLTKQIFACQLSVTEGGPS